MIIHVSVDDHRKVAVQSIEGGSVCGLNVDTIEYELTEEFDLDYKYAFLAIGENVQPVELDALQGSFTMPPMSAGTMRIAFRAFDLEDGQKAHEVITERMARGIRIERHGKHSFGAMEPEANDVLAKMVQAATDAEAAKVAAEAATTASIEQTNAAKAAEEQRETAFNAKMGEWNRSIVDAISDTNAAKASADAATKAANDAADAANKAAEDAEKLISDTEADYRENVVDDYEHRIPQWNERIEELATMFYIDENGYICQKED